MASHLVHKKRNILQNLNVHLQVQAIKLGYVDRETNILPNSLVNNKDTKTTKTLKPKPLNQTWQKAIMPSQNNKIIYTKNATQKPKGKKLRPYDPLYTWNRGGRLKELRIRCQARKFLYIWMTKSLGRVTEMRAVAFYREQLIKKYWNIWYEQYWQIRIEPRWLGRAILHRKCLVLRSTFLAWHWWTQLRTFARVKIEIAVKYRDNHLKKMVLDVWQAWILLRRCKMKLTVVGNDWRKKNLLSHFLNIWKEQFIIQRDTDAKMTIAVRQNTFNIQRKAFLHWIEVGPDLKQEKIGNQKADYFHHHNLLKKCLEHWLQYRHCYRLKQKELDKWRDHFHWNLAQRYLKKWREQYVRSLTMSVVDIRVDDLRKRFQLRRIFESWRCYTGTRREKNEAVESADKFYGLTLKRKVLAGMGRFCVVARQQSDMRVRGREFNDRITLQRYLRKWSDMLEYKDDQTRRVELGAARAHYRSDNTSIDRTTFIKCFRHFSTFVAKSSVLKERKKIADRFRQQRVQQRCLVAWQQYLVDIKHKNLIIQLKNDYLKERVLSLVWTRWRNKTFQRLSVKATFSEFVNKKEVNDKIKLLQIWRWKAEEVTRMKFCTDKAVMYYRKRLLQKCFSSMKMFVEREEEIRCLDTIARDHHRQRLLRKIFGALRSYSDRKSMSMTAVCAHLFYKEYKIKRMAFICWQAYICDRRLRHAAVDQLFQKKQTEMIQMRFNRWYKFARIQRSKRQNSAKLAMIARHQLDQRLQLRTLHYWRQRALERNYVTTKCALAVEFCRMKVVSKYFDSWRLFHEQQRIKARQREQASWFWQKSQMTITWVIWTKALVDRQREDYYTKYALGHWALKLQVKVFGEWLSYKNHRKQKRENEKEAFEMFQRRAKRYTIGQWLRSGDFLSQWRQSQSRVTEDTSTVVSRAFRHWRQWTLTRVTKSTVITSTASEPSTDIIRPRITPVEHKISRTVKSRPAPKIPNFLLKPLDRTDYRPKISHPSNVRGCDSGQMLPGISNDLTGSCPTDLSDDVLLPPASFLVLKAQNNQGRSSKDQSCMEELRDIKERLQKFRDTKESLRSLREEVKEYDRVLSKFSHSNDSSFYEEFNPLGYKEELLCHVKQLEQTLADELPVCSQLMKRAQTLVNMCKDDSR